MRIESMVRILAMALLVIGWRDVAHAQVIGTFSWHTAPYCNVVTVTVVQQGGLYQLLGSDNLCGAGTAPVTGTAVPNGAGVALGFAVALPSGPAGHVSASVSLSTLSGTWTDADANSGAFTFGPGSGAGAPRPLPAPTSAITVAQFAPTVYAGTGTAATIARSDHIHDDRYFTETEINTRLAAPRTMTLAGGGFVARGGDAVWGPGQACFTNTTPANGIRHTIPVVAGSTITGLTVRTHADMASQAFTITIWSQAPATSSTTAVIAQPLVSSAIAGLTTSTVVVTPAKVVAPGEAVYLSFVSNSANIALCAVDVAFTPPS